MAVERTRDNWMTTTAEETVVIDGRDLSLVDLSVSDAEKKRRLDTGSETCNVTEYKLGFTERAFSAAGAAVLSAIIVNPLDVAKVSLY